MKWLGLDANSIGLSCGKFIEKYFKKSNLPKVNSSSEMGAL